MRSFTPSEQDIPSSSLSVEPASPSARHPHPLRRADLWWLSLFPLYLVLSTLRHELAHALAHLARGAKLYALVFWPTWRPQRGLAWGYIESSLPSSLLSICAPYLANLLIFFATYWLCSRRPFRHHWLWLQCVILGMLSPMIDTLYNYINGILRAKGDIYFLSSQFHPLLAHAFCLASCALFFIGLVQLRFHTPDGLQRWLRPQPPRALPRVHDDLLVRLRYVWSAPRLRRLRYLVLCVAPMLLLMASFSSSPRKKRIALLHKWSLEPSRPPQSRLLALRTLRELSPRGIPKALYDRTLRKLAGTLLHRRTLQTGMGPLQAVRWSPKGRFVACLSEDGQIGLWSPKGPMPLSTQDGPSLQRKRSKLPKRATVLGQSKLPKHATVSKRRDVVGDWRSLPVRLSKRGLFVWHPSRARLALRKHDNEISIWDAHNVRWERRFGGHIDPVRFLRWSPNGGMLASASRHTLVIRAVRSGRSLLVHRNFQQSIQGIFWSPLGRYLVLLETHNFISLWGRRHGSFWRLRTQDLIPHPVQLKRVYWSPDARYIALVGQKPGTPLRQILATWRVRGGRLVAKSPPFLGSVHLSWHPKSHHLLSRHPRSLRLWTRDPLRLLRFFSLRSPVTSLQWHPQDDLLAFATGQTAFYVWRTTQPKPLPYAGHHSTVRAVRWSPRGKRLVTASAKGTLKLWAPLPSFSANLHPQAWLALLSCGIPLQLRDLAISPTPPNLLRRHCEQNP